MSDVTFPALGDLFIMVPLILPVVLTSGLDPLKMMLNWHDLK